MGSVGYPLIHSHLLIRRLLQLNPNTGPAHHYIYLLGETTQVRHDTDRELPFRQESNFAWLSGCDVPGAAVVVDCEYEGGPLEHELEKVKTTLYLPEVDPEEVMWCGLPPTPDFLSKTISVTSIEPGWTPVTLVAPKPQNSHLKTFIHTLPWTKPPRGLIASINGPTYTDKYLLKALHEARRNKTNTEIELMGKASEITAQAHMSLMKGIGRGEVTNEGEAEALFVSVCRKMGSKHQAYTPIMAAGSHAGTLHYVKNDEPFPDVKKTKGALILVDAGAEYNNYAADVTRCIPIGNGGKFTKECKDIYELVLQMQESAFQLIKPKADWEGIQKLMHDVLARGLIKLGIFKAAGKTEDEAVKVIVESGLTTAFYPHGVGHLLGLDVHDVGGLPEGKSKEPLLKYLRLRVPLEEGFVVTVEPGCYFNEFLYQKFKGSEWVEETVLKQYWYVGGVRIEDNLLVTSTGFDNLTPSGFKTVAEVEALTSAA